MANDHPAKLWRRENPSSESLMGTERLGAKAPLLLGAALSRVSAPEASHWLYWECCPILGDISHWNCSWPWLAAWNSSISWFWWRKYSHLPSAAAWNSLVVREKSGGGKKRDFCRCLQVQCFVTESGWWHCQAAAGPACPLRPAGLGTGCDPRAQLPVNRCKPQITAANPK